jgi:cupin 2 domain-containing protein
MAITVKNLFAELPAGGDGESFVTLFENAGAKIERIVSHAHSSAADFWYDQADDEWVIVLRGSATLEFASGEIVEMIESDYLTIPRHVKHRVVRTSAETIWLAVNVK